MTGTLDYSGSSNTQYFYECVNSTMDGTATLSLPGTVYAFPMHVDVFGSIADLFVPFNGVFQGSGRGAVDQPPECEASLPLTLSGDLTLR
jgi:hypothetical protein